MGVGGGSNGPEVVIATPYHAAALNAGFGLVGAVIMASTGGDATVLTITVFILSRLGRTIPIHAVFLNAEFIAFTRGHPLNGDTVSSVIAAKIVADTIVLAGGLVSTTPKQARPLAVAVHSVVRTIRVRITRRAYALASHRVANFLFGITAVIARRAIDSTASSAPARIDVAVAARLSVAEWLIIALVVAFAAQSAWIRVTKAASQIHAGHWIESNCIARRGQLLFAAL